MTGPGTGNRIGGAVGAAALQALLLYALVQGLGVAAPPMREESPKLFTLPPPLPAVAEHRPVQVAKHRPRGAAAPPNLRAQPVEVMAPRPVVPLPEPPPLVVAPLPGVGRDPAAGAADMPGPGTGAGGLGSGTGGGGRGDGDGGFGRETPPRRLRGSLRNSDFPRAAIEAGVGGTVSVRYTVAVDGRVTACRVTASSGNSALDENTCRLIMRRFRFDPARNADGRPVASTIVEDHSWEIERVPAEGPSPPRDGGG